jgi:hypothetical protein
MREDTTMKNRLFAAGAILLISLPSAAFDQVPPDIAAGIRKIGPILDTVNTAKLYPPLFQNQKEPYPNVTVTRDLAYGPDAANNMVVWSHDVYQASRRELAELRPLTTIVGGSVVYE